MGISCAFLGNPFFQFKRELTLSRQISILELNANIAMWSSYNRCFPDLLIQPNGPESNMNISIKQLLKFTKVCVAAT